MPVYFAHIQGDLYKIGRSVNPRKRMRELRRGAPEPVSGTPRILKIWRPAHATDEDIERALLQRHASACVHGQEWFRLSEAARDSLLALEIESVAPASRPGSATVRLHPAVVDRTRRLIGRAGRTQAAVMREALERGMRELETKYGLARGR